MRPYGCGWAFLGVGTTVVKIVLRNSLKLGPSYRNSEVIRDKNMLDTYVITKGGSFPQHQARCCWHQSAGSRLVLALEVVCHLFHSHKLHSLVFLKVFDQPMPKEISSGSFEFSPNPKLTSRA
jgi:hypothetical protein